jgi:Ca2+-binding EF-hand superfamily protein
MSSSKQIRSDTDNTLKKDGQLNSRLKTMFDSLDKDKSGIIGPDELLAGMNSWGYELGEAQIDAIQLGFGGESQDIDFEEFQVFLNFFADVRAKFKQFDVDDSNSVDKKELARLLFDLLPFVTAPIVENALKIFDTDNSSQLEFAEVFSLLVGLRDLQTRFPAKTTTVQLDTSKYQLLMRSMSIFASVAEAGAQLETDAKANLSPTLDTLLAMMVQFTENRTKYVQLAYEARQKSRQSETLSSPRKSAKSNVKLNSTNSFANNDVEKKLLASFKSSGKKFEDPEFPATTASLFPRPDEESKATLAAVGDWKRPDAIAPKGKTPAMFLDGISQGDVMQGSLGDCWFATVFGLLSFDSSNSSFRSGLFPRLRSWRSMEPTSSRIWLCLSILKRASTKFSFGRTANGA